MGEDIVKRNNASQRAIGLFLRKQKEERKREAKRSSVLYDWGFIGLTGWKKVAYHASPIRVTHTTWPSDDAWLSGCTRDKQQ
jgi:hypothetical protein